MPKKLTCLLFFSALAFAQNQVKVAPDCTTGVAVLLSGGASSNTLDNRPQSTVTGTPCTTWILMYTASAGSPSITISVQEAPNSNGVPGTWADIPSASSSTSPSGSILVKNSAGNGYYPFIRIHLTTIGSGSVSAVLNGWRDDAGSISGGGGGGSGCTAPCVVVGPTGQGNPPVNSPVYVAGIDASGNILPLTSCTLKAIVNISSSGNNQVVAAVSGKSIRVCNVDLSFPSPAAFTFQLTSGTGPNCSTGTANVNGATTVTSAVLGSFDDPGNFSPYVIAQSNALCINLSTGVTVTGTVHYAAAF